MLKPTVKIGFSPSAVPDELKALNRWVLWKYVFSKQEKKWKKVPHRPDGSNASSTDSATWSSFDAVCGAYITEDFDGAGFVFNGDGITGVDLDGVIDENGVWSDTAIRALEELDGYAELSPSGTGLHIITRAQHIGTGKRRNGIEVYSTERYFTFTGEQLNGHDAIPAAQQDIAPFLSGFLGEKPAPRASDDPFSDFATKSRTGRSIAQMAEALKVIPCPPDEPDCTPYIWAIHHETEGSPEGLTLTHAWCSGELHGISDPAYDFDYVEERWGRSQDGKMNAKTWRSVETEAKKNGWIGVQETVNPDSLIPAVQFAGSGSIEWHVKYVIPKRALTVIYGAPGSSKSFFALDMVAHVVRGLPWRGHRVRQSRVVYVAAEGAEGFRTRVKAYHEHHGAILDGLFVRPGSLLLDMHVTGLCEAVNALGNVGVVVIDTLAAVTPGANENTSEDMGRAIAHANLITEATGAAVILIHHANKNGEMRGWSGLLAAADNTIRIERKDDIRTAHIEKQKDGKDSGEYGYRLKVVDLGTDSDGDPVTSCVVEPCEEVAPNTGSKGTRKEKKSTSGDFENSLKNMHGRRYLEIIQDLGGLGGVNIDIDAIVEAAQSDELLNTSGEPGHPAKSSVVRSVNRLGDKGKLVREGRWIRLCTD